MTQDPFTVLGLSPRATAEDVRAARRELARRHHPDAGGDPDAMQAVNVAAAEALRVLAEANQPAATTATTATTGRPTEWVGARQDIPSFTVEALPVDTFEALLLVANELGEIEDDDPPYALRTLLDEPTPCWCQLDVVPDAGGSTVSVTIAAADDAELPALVNVRNAWINALNALDWSALG